MRKKIVSFLIATTLLSYVFAGLKVDLNTKSNAKNTIHGIQDIISSRIPLAEQDINDLKQAKIPDSLKGVYKNERVNLTNFKDSEYSGPLKIGSQNEEFIVKYDTGSHWLWIPHPDCEGCPTNHSLDPNSSATYSTKMKSKTIEYSTGRVEGIISNDNIAVGDSSPVNIDFVHTKKTSGLEDMECDGAIGLSLATPDQGKLLVDVLYETGAINKREFMVYIGKEGFDDSYIEFGEYQGNKTNGTVLEVKPDGNSGTYYHWNVTLDILHYKNTIQELSTYNTVWDTGTSTIGFPVRDFSLLLFSIADERGLYYVPGLGFGYDCKNVDDNNSDLHFKFGNKEVKVSPHEFLIFHQGFCIIDLFEIGDSDYILLGGSFLRGSRVLHDQENKQIVLFEQTVYDYGDSDSQKSLLWFWALLSFIGVLNIFMTVFCVWRSKHKDTQKEMYARINPRINYV